MRHPLASLTLFVGLIAASFAWWGHTLERSVGDRARSDAVVDVLLADEGVEDGLVDAAVTGVRRGLPADLAVALPPDQLETAARGALATPEAQAELRSALTGVHAYVTGGIEAVPVITGGPVDAALRQQLSVLRPDLAPAVAALPPLSITLPAEGLDTARSSREALSDLVRGAAILGAVGLAAALLLSPRRSGVIRTMGWWALVTGGVWLVLRFAVSPLAAWLQPSDSALLGGLAVAVAESMLWPGLILIAVGNVLFLGGSLIDWADRRRHARSVASGMSEDLRWSSHAAIPPAWDQAQAAAPAPAGMAAGPMAASAPWLAPLPAQDATTGWPGSVLSADPVASSAPAPPPADHAPVPTYASLVGAGHATPAAAGPGAAAGLSATPTGQAWPGAVAAGPRPDVPPPTVEGGGVTRSEVRGDQVWIGAPASAHRPDDRVTGQGYVTEDVTIVDQG